MTVRTLSELKAFFETGDVPTETQFSDTLDSTHNNEGLVTATGSTTGRALAERFAESINAFDEGCQAVGLAFDDTANFQAAVLRAEAAGKGLYLPPPAIGNFYNFATNPVLVRGPIDIWSDGDCLIKNTKATDSPVSSTTVFLFGNNHPKLLENVTSFACSAITAGDEAVTSATATGIAVGDPVWIKSTKNYVDTAVNTIREFYQLNCVTGIAGNDYSMLHPIDEDVATPLMQPANTSEEQGLLGNDLFVAQDVRVRGVSVWSENGRPISRGGALDCSFHFPLMKGIDGIFGNGWTNCRFDVDHMIVNRKLQDPAMGSAGNVIRVKRADYIDTGEVSAAQIRHGENCRDNDAVYEVVNLAEGALVNPVVSFSFCRRNRVRVGTVFAPTHANAAVAFINAVEAPDQPVTHDNSVEFGVFKGGASLERFVNHDNSGGEDKRNSVLRGHFQGTVSAAAAQVDGDSNYIGPDCIFDDGGLDLNAGATNCRIYGTFKDWISAVASDAHLSNEVAIWSDKQKNAKEHSVVVQAVNNITTTTPNTIQNTTGAIDADTLSAVGNIRSRVRIEIAGEILSTNDTKQLALADDTGVFNTFTIAAGTTGTFRLRADIFVMSNARYDYVGHLTDSTGDTLSTVARTGLDLVLNTRTIDFQAWVTNASDTIRLKSVSMVIDVGTNPDLFA